MTGDIYARAETGGTGSIARTDEAPSPVQGRIQQFCENLGRVLSKGRQMTTSPGNTIYFEGHAGNVNGVASRCTNFNKKIA